jgi:ubiquinol-cytochrome c reductase cytochrome b subunit
MATRKRDPVEDPVRFIDQRTASAPALRMAMRYLFPDHWSFLLGEVALYAFVVLIITGVYLALFYSPSTAQTIYHGPYKPLDGQSMSAAYRSVIHISFTVKAGLLMRQTHHWAADVFIAMIVVHLIRVFFTGAFRKPRELTWTVGLIILTVVLLEGYMGYSLIDDLLSGMGLQIGYGVGLSIPVVGGPLMLWIFGAPFPGAQAFFSRLYIMHVFVIPILLTTLIGVHLVLIAARHHTQFKESKRTTNRRIVGVPMFPGQAPRSMALMFFTVGILFLLGGLVQINPIWQWGPFHPWLGENGAQPDWYLGWLIGALRLMPDFDVTIGHFTLIPNPFWGGVVFPGVIFAGLFAFPWLEAKLTGDHGVHNLAQRPREAPNRTAFGFALLVFLLIVFAFGAADRIYVLVGLGYRTQLMAARIALIAVPPLVFLVTRHVCRGLQAGDRIDQAREQAEEEAAAHARALAGARGPSG